MVSLIVLSSFSKFIFRNTRKDTGSYSCIGPKFCLVLPVMSEGVAHCSRLLCSTFASFKMLHKRGINKLSLEHRWLCGTPVGNGTLTNTHKKNRSMLVDSKNNLILKKNLITQIKVTLMSGHIY